MTYTYNPDGTVDTMTSNSGGTFTYGYDNYGRLCRITRADGSVEERKYDAAGQLTDQVDKDKSGNILQKNHYDYDVFGEITGKTTSTSGDTDRLVTVSMEYNLANRLIKYNGQDVTYDSRGNMIYGPVDGEMTNLEYDCRNRLVKAGKVSYTYDCENTRIATEEDGITTEYVTDTGGSLSRILIAYENIGTANTSETHYYYGPEGLAAQNNDTTGQYFAYHYDNIGSTTLVTDKTGRKVEEFAYGTYGELLTEPKNNIRFLYNGSYGVVTDSNGLYYMRARYYNPDIKRFINQDIKVGDISNGQGLNRYAYCEGNPVSMVDPFGLCGMDALYKELFSLGVHLTLGALGLIPVFGNVFDVADAAFSYYYDEDPLGAGISLACALPWAGIGLGAAKNGEKIVKLCDKIPELLRDSKKIVKTADTAADAAKLSRDMKRLGIMDNLGNVFVKSEKLGDFLKNGGEGLKRVAKALGSKGDDVYTSAKKLTKQEKNVQKYYHVTSKKVAKELSSVNNPRLKGTEFKQVFAWIQQPTLKQAKKSGARYIETVIEFETDVSFSKDVSIVDTSLHDIARISDRPGPISISNVKEVGFKKIKRWWEFWKK